MNANVSRDVIMDLLPAFLSGEVSSDSRVLIENFTKQDPEFAAHVKNESKALLTQNVSVSMRRDREMEALHKTKRLISRRGWHLAFAIFFTLTAVSYQFGPKGFKWTWQDAPFVSVLSVAVGVFFWIVYFHSKHRLKSTGV